MSIYYFLYSEKTKEFFELTSGSWYPYMEDMFDVLRSHIRGKSSYKAFIKDLKKKEVFKYFYDDDGEFITPDNEKYFLRPLYDWSSKFKPDELYLIDDGKLYDAAVECMCKDKQITYAKKDWFNYSDEIESALAKEKIKDSFDGITARYLKCVGKLFYEEDDKILSDIGVSFERALSELKAGATIWRKGNPKAKVFLAEPGCLSLVGDEGKRGDHLIAFPDYDILANDWQYEYHLEGK